MSSQQSATELAPPTGSVMASDDDAEWQRREHEPEHVAGMLEQRFSTIQAERMQDMPMLNPALEVRAVGFQRWQNHCLGILITPWFMNLVLLPATAAPAPAPAGDDESSDPATVPPARVGDSQRHAFPSGSYLFTVAIDEELGRYLTCSLFSPMNEFADQATAEQVAEAAIDALMDDGNRDDSGNPHHKEVERRWRGEPEQDDADPETTSNANGNTRLADDNDSAATTSDEGQAGQLSSASAPPNAAPISRRELLRGVFRGGNGQSTSRNDTPPPSDTGDV